MQQRGSQSPRPLGWGKKVKIQLFQNMVMLHITLSGITNAATRKHIFCPYTHPRPLGGDKCQTFFFESSHIAYQIRREWSIQHRASIYSVLTHTLNIWVGLKGKHKSECDHVAH